MKWRDDLPCGRRAGALLLFIVGITGACATPGTAASGGATSAGGAKMVLLRVDAEEFTRADLERVNPQLFTPGVTHGKMLREAFIQRFVDFRLSVAEARRRGLDSSETYRTRFAAYLDAKGAEALVARMKIKEEKPGEYEDDRLAEGLVGDQRRAQIRVKLQQPAGKAPQSRHVRDGNTLASMAGADAGKVLAQVGADRVTVGQVRDFLSQEGISAPMEADAARALDELVLYREVVAAARAAGLTDRAATGEAADAFREKLLEAVLGETLVPPGSLAAAAMADYFTANGARYERVEAVRLRRMLLKEADAGVYRRVRNGEDFAALAKEFSVDAATAQAGGDMGWVTPETKGIPPQAFTLKAGEHSRLITKPNKQFELLRADERRVARPPLETIGEQVRRDAEAEARVMAMRDLVAGLRANAKIWMGEDLTKVLTK